MRLALLLPLRKQALADLRADNIVLDGDGGEIRLQAQQTKNRKEAFVLPLTGSALAIVRELLAGTSSPADLLIPMNKHGGPFTSWCRFTGQVAREAGLHFHWHDTRRMFASEMSEHGASNFWTVDALLNHAKSASISGAARSYHLATEKPARLAAMVAWDRLVMHAAEHGAWPRQMSPVDTNNVVPLASGRAP